MNLIIESGMSLAPTWTASWLTDLGFLVHPDLPDRPGPACLLIAIRSEPTLRHFDPEAVEYWVTEAGRGARRTLTRDTRMRVETEFGDLWALLQAEERRLRADHPTEWAAGSTLQEWFLGSNRVA
jgi:hypothetical protein